MSATADAISSFAERLEPMGRILEDDNYYVWCCALFCSDGLSSYAEDAQIAEVIAGAPTAKCCDQLVDYVNKHGGRDNVTVAVVSI